MSETTLSEIARQSMPAKGLDFYQRYIKQLPDFGVYADVPASVYHRWPAVSKSLLHVIDTQTMAHVRQELEHPEDRRSQALDEGTLYHLYLLQRRHFDSMVAPAPINPKTGVEYGRDSKAYEAAREAAGDKLLLGKSDVARMQAMSEALARKPLAKSLARCKGEYEVSILWKDEATGLPCKARLDKLVRGQCVVDLKTVGRSASMHAFGRDASAFGYDTQAAHYLEGCRVLGLGCSRFAFIAQEDYPPYESAVYYVSDEHAEAALPLESARVRVRECMARLSACLKSDSWPGYGDEALPLRLPEWRTRNVGE
jgi:hypothetical protein